jgi:uncharacterized protein
LHRLTQRNHHVAAGYDADILLRWGDPIFADSPEFDPANQTPEAQARQFGYNNDYVGFIPLDGSSEHGLLVVNHEYTNPHLMFPGIVTVSGGKISQKPLTKERVDIEMAAHGGTIVEIEQTGDFEGMVSWGIGLTHKACYAVDAAPDHLTITFFL